MHSCESKSDYYKTPTYSKNQFLNAIIEIPAGTNKKIEFSKEAQKFLVDSLNGQERIINFLPYPGNYGFIPSTLSDPKNGGDGDALDVLVLSQTVPIGTVLEIVPIAVLKLIDKGELDYKIIGNIQDPNQQIISAMSYKELSETYPNIKKIIELWFLNYNKEDEARILGWGDENEAINEVLKNKIK